MSQTTTLPEFEKDTHVYLDQYKPSEFLADHVKLHINLNDVDAQDKDGKKVKQVLATVTNSTTFSRRPLPTAEALKQAQDAYYNEAHYIDEEKPRKDALAEQTRRHQEALDSRPTDLVLKGGIKKDKEGKNIPYLQLEGKGLGLWVNGKAYYDFNIDYETGDLIIHNLPRDQESFEITTKTITNASANTSGLGLYEKGGLVSTQCESEGFRNITYSLDRPDVISTYDVTLEADKERFPMLLANPGAEFVEPTDLGNGRHAAHWVDDRPKPCYLFAATALNGSMIDDVFEYPDGDRIELRYYTDKGKGEQARFAMECLKEAIKHEWEVWGHKYHGLKDDPERPGKKKGLFMTLAVEAFNMGAMENNGLNVFLDRLVLATPQNATDSRYFQIDSVVNHEYCHDETGNWRVPANWFQIAYKEGLTVRRDQTYTADLYDATYGRISDVQAVRSAVFERDQGSETHPMILRAYKGLNNAYDKLTYEKGAEVNRMLQSFVGNEAYAKAYREFHDNPHPEVCDIPSYLSFIGNNAGMRVIYGGDGKENRLIDHFVDSWTNQSGVPTLKCDWVYDKEKKVLRLEVEQILPPGATKPFVLPLKTGLVNPETGKDYFLIEPGGKRYLSDVLTIDSMKQTFEFAIVPEQGKEAVEPLVSLNRDASAYAKIEYADRVKPTFEKLALQASIDPNFFNRWDALQQIGTELLMAKLRGESPDISSLTGAYRAVLQHPDMKPLLKAEMLRLPDESTLSNLLPAGTVDPVAVHNAREALREQLAAALQPELKATYDAMQSDAPFVFNGEEMGRRALMNLSLSYLCAGKSAEGAALAKAQFDKMHNYNDISAAWGLIMDGPSKQAADDAVKKIAEAYQLEDREQGDKLVRTSWLSQQIAADGAGIETAKGLMALRMFDLSNQSMARAVLGGFVGNVKAFHATDGSGYRFIAEQIATLDDVNAEIAARIASVAFGTLTTFTPDIQDRMMQAIGELRQLRGSALSGDVQEVLEKAAKAYEEARAPKIVHEGTLDGSERGAAVA